jgi:hypothetical protein
MINAILLTIVRNALLILGISALVLLNTAVWSGGTTRTPAASTMTQPDNSNLASRG